MKFLQKLGIANFIMLMLCGVIISVAEYLFMSGEQLHGIFIGLWAPMLLGLLILFKIVNNGSK